jgi:hypothetical protein
LRFRLKSGVHTAFNEARRIAGGQRNPVIAVNGCCYGKDSSPDKDTVLNKFTLAFTQEFCEVDGRIEWSKLLVFNSGSAKWLKALG